MLRNTRSIFAQFTRQQHGVVAIQAAIALPILILITFAGIEFGMYYVKSQSASNVIANAIMPLQQNPDDMEIRDEMFRGGGTLLNFSAEGNYVCAQAYATYDAALGGGCNGNYWMPQRPAGVPTGTPYYVALSAKTTNPINVFFNLRDIAHTQIVRMGDSQCGVNCIRIGNVMTQFGVVDLATHRSAPMSDDEFMRLYGDDLETGNVQYGAMPVTFDTPYSEAPAVLITSQGNADNATVVNVSEDGFTILVQKLGGSPNQTNLPQSTTDFRRRSGSGGSITGKYSWQAIGNTE